MVSNTPNFDFFNYAGIGRPVRLYTTPTSYIRDITISTEVHGTVAQVGDAEVRVTIRDESGAIVAHSTGARDLLHIEQVHLWQPRHAYLYTCVVELWQDGQLLDSYEQLFGIRTVEVRNSQFLINGRGFDEAVALKDLNLLLWMGAILSAPLTIPMLKN